MAPLENLMEVDQKLEVMAVITGIIGPLKEDALFLQLSFH